MQDYTDKQMLELFEKQESKVFAFECMVQKYSKKLYWTIRKIVVSHHDTDDILQNVLIKLWQELPTFRGESSIYTWLYRIAVNQSLSHLRARKRSSSNPCDDDTELFERIVADQGLFDADAAELALQRAIQTLPPKQRAVFIMRYYDQMPYEQMAQVMQTSQGALKASYHIAREKIEEQIKLSLT